MNLVERPRAAAASRTMLDRVVGYFWPRAGLTRLHDRMMLDASTGGGFKGGRRDRRPTKRWRPFEGSADADLLPDLPDLRARSRDLARNAPIATGAINTNVTNVIGEGLILQASINADVLGISEEQASQYQREQEREFEHFCRTCDFSRVQSFERLQALVYRAAKESGDVIVVRRFRKDAGDLYGTKLQVIEADRLSNPNRVADTDTIAGGVEIDRDGVPVAYHISDRHPGALRQKAMSWQRIASRTPDGVPVVLHLFDRQRPEQTRGIPYLAPVIEHLKQLSDYSDAEVTAAVISAMFTLAIETPADDDQNPAIGERDTTLETNEVKLGNGAVISLAPGESAKPISPMRPNSQFDPFVLAFVRQMGAALEIGEELLIKKFTASYSASRAALEMAWQYFRTQRAWFAGDFAQVAYEWMMEEAVGSGRLNRPGFFEDPFIRQAYLGAEWIGSAKFSLDPKKEAEADKIDLELCVTTREEIMRRRTGGELDKKIAQLGKEKRAIDAEGIAPAPAVQGASAQTAGDADENVDDDTDTEDQPQQRARA